MGQTMARYTLTRSSHSSLGEHEALPGAVYMGARQGQIHVYHVLTRQLVGSQYPEPHRSPENLSPEKRPKQ